MLSRRAGVIPITAAEGKKRSLARWARRRGRSPLLRIGVGVGFSARVSPSADDCPRRAEGRPRSPDAGRTTRAPLRAHRSSRCSRKSSRYALPSLATTGSAAARAPAWSIPRATHRTPRPGQGFPSRYSLGPCRGPRIRSPSILPFRRFTRRFGRPEWPCSRLRQARGRLPGYRWRCCTSPGSAPAAS